MFLWSFYLLIYLCVVAATNPSLCCVGSHTMATTYHEYKDQDQFLYITYSGENVFGGEAGL